VREGDRVGAGGHPGPAGHDRRRVIRDAKRGVVTPKLVGRFHAAVRIEVFGPRRVAGTGDMAGAGIDRLVVAAVAVGRSGIENHARTGCEDFDDVVGGYADSFGPGTNANIDGDWFPAGAGFEWTVVGAEPAIEQRCGLTDRPKHPHQSRRRTSARGVVSNDDVVGTDAESAKARGKRGRRGEGVTSVGGGPVRVVGEIVIEIDEDRAGQMAPFEIVSLRTGSERPANVGKHAARMRCKPADCHDRRHDRRDSVLCHKVTTLRRRTRPALDDLDLRTMNIESMERFFATLSLLAGAGAIGLVVARFVPAGASLVTLFRTYALSSAFVVAATCTLGSLYFSEIEHLRPCRLCWFQRSMMYPLAVILLVAVVRRDRGIRPYALALAGIGALFSTYHYLIEWNIIKEGSSCDPTNPCSALPFDRQYGFVSLSFMALAGFAFIVAVLTLPAGDPK
jgi:disulfide bond formation protein DsbB